VEQSHIVKLCSHVISPVTTECFRPRLTGSHFEHILVFASSVFTSINTNVMNGLEYWQYHTRFV